MPMCLLLSHSISGTGREYPKPAKTLLAILVENLPRRGGWPDSNPSESITQDANGKIFSMSGNFFFDRSANQWLVKNGNYAQIIFPTAPELASDYQTAIITRDKYEAALANRKASQAKPCPTLGAECLGCPDCGRRVSCTSDDITDAAVRADLGMTSRANDDRLAQDVKFASVDDGRGFGNGVVADASTGKPVDEADLNDCIGQSEDLGQLSRLIVEHISFCAPEISVGAATKIASSLVDAGYRKQ